MKTRAVLYEMEASQPYKESKPLKIESLELENPHEHEVLLKIHAGLCHSDLSVINGSRPRSLPMVLGHEATGEVLKVGSSVTRVKEGDHVVCTFIPSVVNVYHVKKDVHFV